MSKREFQEPQGTAGQGDDAQDLAQLARMFKALSNPHRLHIYRELRARAGNTVSRRRADEACNCQCEFASRLGIAPSTVSHHFKELREAGLVHTRRDGKDVLFWVDAEAAQALRHLLD